MQPAGNVGGASRISKKMSIGKLAIFLSFAASAAYAQHLSVGLVGGVPFTGSFSDFTSATTELAGAVEATFSTRTYSNSNEYIVGPMVEVRLPLSLAIEVDALYRPLELSTQAPASGTGAPFGTTSIQSSQTFSSWEFPVLGKYRLPLAPVLKPFVEAGPNFREVSSSLSWLSGKGFVLGGGLEVKIARLRIAPAIRYTHWGSDAKESGLLFTPGSGNPAITYTTPPPSNQNQAEFLVGFSF